MADKKGWCQHDAGVLKDGKLSPEAKYKFIQDFKDLLKNGTKDAAVPALPCGPEIPPMEFADMALIEREDLYPDFWKNVFGQYEKIALALDAKGSFPLFPIADPTALAMALDMSPPKLDFPGDMLIYGIALPMLAIKLEFQLPIDLLAKLPDIPTIPQPPQIPEIDFDLLKLPELWKFNGLLFDIPPKLIDVVLNLIVKMPELVFKMFKVPPDLSAFCDAVFDAKPFGPFDTSSNTTWAAANVILTRKTAECVCIHVVGATIGSSSGGATGWLGGPNMFGYDPPPPDEALVENIRNKIVRAANNAFGYTWAKDDEALKKGETPEYQQFLLPEECEQARAGGTSTSYNQGTLMQKHIELKDKSSCGLFARACLRAGGAMGQEFQGIYNFNKPTVFTDIHNAARRGGAEINFDPKGSTMPALRKGDILHVMPVPNGNNPGHMLVITSDYAGGSGDVNISAVAGGIQTGSPPSYSIGNNTIGWIGREQNVFGIKYINDVEALGGFRQVMKIIDSEKLVKGTRGGA